MLTNLSALARNRKVHLLLASIAFLLAITHTLGTKGIAIDYTRYRPHSHLTSYATVSETLSLNAVVSDIKFQRCLRGFSCSGPADTSSTLWEKVPVKLNLFPDSFHPFNYYMYVEKSAAVQSEKYIVGFAFTTTNQPPQENPHEGSKIIERKIWSGGYLWIYYVEDVDFNIPIVHDVNVFFGKEDMKDSRRYWKFEPTPIPLPGKYSTHAKLSALTIAIVDEIHILEKEREFDTILKKDEMIVTTNPKFKIMQLSDLHIGQDSGVCYDDCKFDLDTLNFVENAIKKEGDVSLVVITGDMIDSRRTVHHESVILKALSPILEAKIPFIFTFGDSDYDHSNYLSKLNALNFIASLPGCYNKKVEELDHRIHGLSNGNLNVYNVPPTKEAEKINLESLPVESADAIITYLDSEGKSVKDSQANYVYRVNHRLSAETDQKLLFLHYPLPNFRPSGSAKLIGGYHEKHPLATETDKKFLDDMKASGYKAVAVGHEHENDACIWEESNAAKVLLCYSGITGESGHTKLDPAYKRRLRVFELDFENNRIYSWKRDQEKSLDPQEIWSAEGSS